MGTAREGRGISEREFYHRSYFERRKSRSCKERDCCMYECTRFVNRKVACREESVFLGLLNTHTHTSSVQACAGFAFEMNGGPSIFFFLLGAFPSAVCY